MKWTKPFLAGIIALSAFSTTAHAETTKPVNTVATATSEEVDTTPPGDVKDLTYTVYNDAIYIEFVGPDDPDYKGIAVYDQNGKWIEDVDKEDSWFYLDGLKRNTNYTLYFYTYDVNGNEQDDEHGVYFEFKTDNDSTPPKQPTKFTAKRVGNNIVYSWINPTDKDFYGMVLTLPNKKVVTLEDGEKSYTYKSANFTTVQTASLVAEDENGNKAKAVVLNWDDPKRAPIEAKNVTYKDVNGVITVNFTPANEYDYSYTLVTLPNGKTTKVLKGKNSFTYNGTTVVGKPYSFTFKSVDTLGNKSKGFKSTFTPKAITFNLTMRTRSTVTLRTTASATGTKVVTVASSKNVKMLSKGYGPKREYAYVQYGTKKGYVLSSSLLEYFANCTDLRKKYPKGVPSTHQAYQTKLDRDKDKYACEN
ncbi:excalibur calcium-binding domain-containing protein [Bacillus sp. AFS017336]|uniref:excalibur calcium-binding domain-containing protein n=1 Tax=Bacillus sp. AFS017336 TaxID=2033489 RepID=UPI002679B407|nr:excalibur calcium-binding domain-containing protein [Bacillus sp. AFS017336]